MNNLSKALVIVGVAGLSSLSQIAAAQSDPVKKALQRELPVIILPPGLVPFSAPFPCPTGSSTGCQIDIMIQEGPINGVQACLANLPSEVRVTGVGSTATDRLMVWTLKPPAGSTATYEFQTKHGILVVDDPKSQLKNGGIGDGQGGTDKAQFHWTNRRKQPNNATYLPIILQRIGNVVSLCGAADPKVVNE